MKKSISKVDLPTDAYQAGNSPLKLVANSSTNLEVDVSESP